MSRLAVHRFESLLASIFSRIPSGSALWRLALCAVVAIGFSMGSLTNANAAVQTCDEAGLNAAVAAGGTNTFSCGVATTITVTGTKAVSVNGTVLDGTGLLTISGGGAYRLFLVNSGVTATFQNLTIADGLSGGGGGIGNNGGTTNVNNCTFSNNSAAGGSGGAIGNDGTMTITASTFLGNSAGDGAAVFSNSGAVTIGNSTFSNNTAAIRGGAVAIATGSVTIVNSTLTGNSASASGGGGIYGNATIENTIVANNQAGGARNCNGVITAGIDSLSDDATCGAATVKTLAQINFGNLTGRPAYFQLNPGSAAIDAGNNAYCAAPPVNNTSQNGVTRPVGAACDIGSYEAPAGVSAAATSIPTMSAAGMILLSGLLAFFGMVKTRHRWLRSVHIRVHR